MPEHWEQDCLRLGTDRNRVKHRGFRHEAQRYVEMYEQVVYSVSHDLPGIDAMPRSAYMLGFDLDPTSILRTPPMFDRWGDPKRFTRY